jgi:molybdate transport system substrate-binding protein
MKNSFRLIATIFLTLLCFMQAKIIGAAEIKVLSAVAMRPVLGDLTGKFERTTGHKIEIDFATAGVLRGRIQAGELADVTILPRPMMDALLKEERVMTGSEAILARGTVGVAVRAGAAKPDISTVEGLRRSLLASKSIVYGNPAQGSASGIHFARVLQQLGIAEEMKPKTKLASDSGSVDSVVNGEAEIAVAGTMALLRVPGAEFVGPLPAELQNMTDFVYFAAILTGTKNLNAANALIKHLLAPTSARMINAKGMEPG